jgi:hypothetical protein
MSAFIARLPDHAWVHRHRAKVAGFLCGVAIQLVAAGLIQAIWTGGLSDQVVRVPSVYELY